MTEKPIVYHQKGCNAEAYYLTYDYDRDEWCIPMPIGDIYYCPTCGVKLMTHEDYDKLAKDSVSDNPVLEINNNGIVTYVTIDGKEIGQYLTSVRFIHDIGNKPDLIFGYQRAKPTKIMAQLRMCNVYFKEIDTE